MYEKLEKLSQIFQVTSKFLNSQSHTFTDSAEHRSKTVLREQDVTGFTEPSSLSGSHPRWGSRPPTFILIFFFKVVTIPGKDMQHKKLTNNEN